MFGPKQKWLAYDDGSYEPVDPRGNLNRKKRGRDREDWWVVEKDQDWSPPRGKQRPMNAPSKGRPGTRAEAKAGASTPEQRKQSILSGGLSAGPRKQAKPKGTMSFMEGEWDWRDKGKLFPIPGEGKKKPQIFDELPRYPGPGGPVKRDPGPDKAELDPWYQLGQNLGGLIWGGKGAPRQNQQQNPPEDEDPKKPKGDYAPVGYPPYRFPELEPIPDDLFKSAHAAARLTPVTAKGKPQVRLLDQGLDPEVEVQGMQPMQAAQSGRAHGDGSGKIVPGSGQGHPDGSSQGSSQDGQDQPDNSPLPSWLGKMSAPKPKEHNPNHDAGEKGQQNQGGPGTEGLDQPGSEVPPPAPRRILGTPEYYKWRAEEFKKRHPDEEPPAYLMDYGYKYAKIFRDEIRPELTDNGKEWLYKTMLGLQQRLEQAYKDGTLDEMNPEAFHDYATGIHAEEYLKNGFRWLHPNDYLTIMGRMAQEPKDFVMAIPEMMEIAPWVVTSGEARNLQGIYEDLKEWKQNKKEGEQIPLHILLRSMPPVQPF